jgi:hypothetical protein
MLRDDTNGQQAANNGGLPGPNPNPGPTPPRPDDNGGGGAPPRPEPPQDPIDVGGGGGGGPLRPGPAPTPGPSGPSRPGGGNTGPVAPVGGTPAPPNGSTPAPSGPTGGGNDSTPVEAKPEAPKDEAKDEEEEKEAKASNEAGSIEFEEVGLLDANGGNEREVMLHFESKRLVVSDSDNEHVVRALPYASISQATYARGRRSGMLRRASHFLTIEAGGAPLVLKVDGGEVEKMVSTLEVRGGIKVKRTEQQ